MLTKQELRQLQGKELNEELEKTLRELMKAKIDHAEGTLKETHKLKSLKRYIARMKTVLKEGEIEAKAKTMKTAKS